MIFWVFFRCLFKVIFKGYLFFSFFSEHTPGLPMLQAYYISNIKSDDNSNSDLAYVHFQGK